MLASHETHIIAASAALADMPLTLIDHYKDVEDGSRRMLAAAHAGDWQQVALLENDCKLMIHGGTRRPACGA